MWPILSRRLSSMGYAFLSKYHQTSKCCTIAVSPRQFMQSRLKLGRHLLRPRYELRASMLINPRCKVTKEHSMPRIMGLSLSGYSSTLPTRTRTPTIRFARDAAVLKVRKSWSREEHESASLKDLVSERVPSLFSEFRPLWWLFNGHLQTIYCAIGNFSRQDQMYYHRIYVRLHDGGTLGLDFSPENESSLPDDTPIIVIQHGLTGGSHEPYVRAVLSRACAPVEEGGLGYRAVVINFRGCAGVPITSQRFYSAGNTDDTRQALMYVAHKYPKAPLLGLGFSLGSNVILRYLGEEGEKSRLQSGCVLACPWNMQQNGYSLVSTFAGKHIYSKTMGGNLLRLMKRHLHVLTEDLNHPVAKAATAALSLRSPTLDMFDNTFTVIAGGPAPHFPFPDVMTFYKWVSSHHMLKDIRVPLLSINAADDPVVRHVPMDDVEANGLVVMGLTPQGGHLGWWQAGKGQVDRWTTAPVLEWLQLMAEGVVPKESKAAPLFVDDDGFIREEGNDELGCKFIGETWINGNIKQTGGLQGL